MEWVSAIEAAICKIHDDKDPNPQPKPKPLAAASSSRDKGSDLMQQLEKSYNAVTQSSTKREVKVREVEEYRVKFLRA